VIAQQTIERVREQTNLVELIGESVKLERRGRSHVGLCPFHQEKTPSFHVNEERGFYHCFGCKASGDAIKFVQQTEGLEFHEAIRRLAERLGIEVLDDLSEAERRQHQAQKRREQMLYDVSAAAAVYFEKMLSEHPERSSALDELERRGLPYGGPAQPTLSAFRIGYAPEGWDGLVQYLRRSGLDLEAAEKVGLLAPRRQGTGHYDRFRHRLMFAVLDLQGRVIAFSGRALPPLPRSTESGEAPAKYINSPESPIYRKRDTVFGLYQARSALRAGEPCVLVEGNFDVVSLHARGVPGAVAPLGTAFTAEQGKLVRRFATTVTFLFDADNAGRKAVLASREPCREAGLGARVASLPTGMDPDEFSRLRGAEGVLAVVRSARGMLEHLIEQALDEGFAANDARARAEKLRQVTELLTEEDDPAVRALAEQHADQVVARLGVADARTFRALRGTVERALRGGGASASANGRVEHGPERAPGPTERPLAPPQKARSRARRDAIAAEIVGALLDFPELLDKPAILAYADQVEGDLAAALAALRQSTVQATAPSEEPRAVVRLDAALAKMPLSIQPFAIARVTAPRHQRVEDAEAELVGNLKKLQQHELSRLASDTVGDLERARRAGDFETELELLREQARRARQRHGL
jgi:DNA primase